MCRLTSKVHRGGGLSRKYIGYCNESMKAGDSIEHQEKAIRRHLEAGFGDLLGVYCEKRGATAELPQLTKALTACQQEGATLLLAKLERLGSDIPFLTALKHACVNFVILDFPAATMETISTILAVARYERTISSRRTKAVIEANKDKGSKFADPANISAETGKLAREKGMRTNRSKADHYARLIGPIAMEYHEDGATLGEIARKLNDDHVLMASGKSGKWTRTAVKNLLARFSSLESETSPEPAAIELHPIFGL